MIKCPGQDQRYWKPEDIFDVKCPHCAYEIEFWKDEPYYYCPECHNMTRNPRLDTGCANWCKYAEECLPGEIIDKQRK